MELIDEGMKQAILGEFLAENGDALRRMEGHLILLESQPDDMDMVHAMFRDMHTVKGSCRMLGFERLEALLHEAESLLGKYRQGVCRMDRQGADLLYRVVDTVTECLPQVAQSGEEGELDFGDLLNRLSRLNQSLGDEPPAQPVVVEEPEKTGERKVSRTELDSHTVRLPIDRLDFLVDLIGELSAASNQLHYEFERNRERALQVMENMEGRIRALQDEVLKYRLQPIGRIWEGYHRLVRDLAMETGKRILLETVGDATEVDRSVLSTVKDAFGHLIRNAADHGLESTEERMAAGKSPLGRIRLMAEQRHGQVHIAVSDDGRGIAVERILAKAVAMGLITSQQSLEISPGEALHLIFAPGFTTTDQVGRISGRGAGMDAVKAMVEKVRGVVEIDTVPGQGTTIRFRIPQTMAIVPVLMIASQEAWYGLPEAQVESLISFHGPEEIRQHIEGKLGKPMVRVQGRLLTLLPLATVFTPRERVLEALLQQPAVHVVTLQGEHGSFAIAVDAIGEIAHLVVKPLAAVLTQSGLFAGALVMPDGRVSLLLDVVEVERAVQTI